LFLILILLGLINFNPGYFLPTYEVIYLIAKPEFKLAKKANAYGDVWEFSQENKNKHPAPFPVDLIERVISSTDAKIIIDPFNGGQGQRLWQQKILIGNLLV